MKNILSFGEIIIDINEGNKTVGGAPLNFASHIARLGNNSYIYTALGNDENGKMAYTELRENGIKEDYITPSDIETGTCLISKDSSLGYIISENASYDNIPYVKLKKSFDLLYFGTLAMRCDVSKNTLTSLFENNFSEVYFDINIRGSFYSDEIIKNALSRCTIYKASREDVMAIGWNGTLESYAEKCAETYPNIKIIIITLDSDGAMVYDISEKRFIYQKAYPCDFVASVGAGDGFSACFIHNYLNGKSIETCLDRACYMGAYVASKAGAIPKYTDELISKIKN